MFYAENRICLEGHRIDKSICHYVLYQNFKNVFGPSVFESLDENICTDAQTIDSVQESEKIYKSVRERSSDCAAAYLTRGEGFIGYLGDTGEGPAAKILLLAMLGRVDLWSL